MTQVFIAASADADVGAIMDDLNIQAGPLVVAKYLALFRQLYERLRVHPDKGPPRRRLGAEIRIGIVLPYIVIYRYAVAADTVIILRVVHGRRRISGRMLSGNVSPTRA